MLCKLKYNMPTRSNYLWWRGEFQMVFGVLFLSCPWDV